MSLVPTGQHAKYPLLTCLLCAGALPRAHIPFKAPTFLLTRAFPHTHRHTFSLSYTHSLSRERAGAVAHAHPHERMSGACPQALDVGAAGKAAPQKITPQRPRLPLPDGESGCPEGWPGGTRLAEKRAGIAEFSSRSRYEPPKATPMATPVVSASLSALGELPVKQIINHHQPLVAALVVVLVVALVVARHRSYQPVPRHPQAPS